VVAARDWRCRGGSSRHYRIELCLLLANAAGTLTAADWLGIPCDGLGDSLARRVHLPAMAIICCGCVFGLHSFVWCGAMIDYYLSARSNKSLDASGGKESKDEGGRMKDEIEHLGRCRSE
jgi:hypothetical protein